MRATDPPGINAPIFAFGDVAEHGGPYMARAGLMQTKVVLDNILAMIRGRVPWRGDKPYVVMEGAIKLILGQRHSVTYAMDADGSDVLIPSRDRQVDLGIEYAWKRYRGTDQIQDA